MLEESAKPAFEKLLYVLAEGSSEDRLSFSRLGFSQRDFFSAQFEAVGRSHRTGVDDIRAHAAISSLMKYLLSIVPSALFKSVSPDFRYLARETLAKHLSGISEDDRCVRTFQVILKRIRSYYLNGRQATSLNLNGVRHKDLLEKQHRRCNHCLYEFSHDLYRYDGEDDDFPTEAYIPNDDEVTVEKLFRRPQLDHVIPLMLGGDEPENWQILCGSCNQGKSDFISASFGLSTNRSLRIEDLFKLSLAKRYSVISEQRRLGSVECTPRDQLFYRIYRVDNHGLLNAENLVAKYL